MSAEDFRDKLNDIKTEISILKQDMNVLRQELDRIKVEDEKILDVLTKMQDNFDKVFNSVMKLVSDSAVHAREHEYVQSNIQSISNRLNDLEKKYSSLEKWILLVTGGGIVLGSIATVVLRQISVFL